MNHNIGDYLQVAKQSLDSSSFDGSMHTFTYLVNIYSQDSTTFDNEINGRIGVDYTYTEGPPEVKEEVIWLGIS